LQTGKQIESLTHIIYSDRNKWILSKKNKDSKTKIVPVFKNKKIKYPILLSGSTSKKYFFKKSKKIEFFDYSKLNFPLQLRQWENGDRIHPLGMKGSKKVSDILIDQKISRLEKESIYVLCSNNDIIWIVGIVISEHFKIGKNSKIFYKIYID
jgi:tRNA(Ile)-lysidine synthetase, C-terminal domain